MATNSITTKKILVAYKPSKPETASSDFLVPATDSTGIFFFGLRSRTQSKQGQMVFIGKRITVNDVFAKLVDSGRKIENVDQTLLTLESYLRMLQDFRIGNILAIETCNEAPCGFEFKKIADAPPTKRINLP